MPTYSPAKVASPAFAYPVQSPVVGQPLSVQQEDPTNPGSWIALTTLTAPTESPQANYVIEQVPLLPSTGSSAKFRFVFTWGTPWSEVALDNVGICEM